MIRYCISHDTTYDYSEPVLCQNVAHLVPRECDRQQADDSILSITPDPAVIEDRIDYFGNPVSYFTIQEQHRELTVSVSHRVVVNAAEPPDPDSSAAWEVIREQLSHDRSPAWLDAYQYVFDSRYVSREPQYADYAATSFTPGRPIIAAALDLTQRIHAEFAYDPRATNLTTPVAEVFENRRGVCQDFAHLMLTCLRSQGLAARYISGYLAAAAPTGKGTSRRCRCDTRLGHVFCGDVGWVD
ncbi:MAG: transglutaminase family protein [Gemmataceae bacterium]